MRAYADLLRCPGVPRLGLAAITTRLAAPMLSLVLVLALLDVGASSGSSALALTAYSAALAVVVPVSARLVDRLRSSSVLLAWLLGHVAAYAFTLVALVQQAPPALLIVGAAALGASTPPAGALVRATWRSVVPAERLQTAFAFDAVINESMFVLGPLVVSLLLLFAEPAVALTVVGLSMTVGVLLLATAPSVRERGPAAPVEKARRRYLGPLGVGQIRVLLGIVLCDTIAFGAIMVGVPIAAVLADARGMSGVLLSIGSFGAVVGALLYGTRKRGGSPGPQLAAFHVAGGLLLVTIGLAPPLVVFALLMLGVGLVGGPRDTLHQLVLGEATPEHFQTEAFAWLSTFMWAGYALGSGLAGSLISGRADADLAFYLAGGAAALAAAVSLLVRRPAHTPVTASG